MTSHSGNRAVTRQSKKYSCKMIGGRYEANVFITSGRSCNGRVQLRRFRAIEPTGIRDQLDGRDYGGGLMAQQWQALVRLRERLGGRERRTAAQKHA